MFDFISCLKVSRPTHFLWCERYFERKGREDVIKKFIAGFLVWDFSSKCDDGSKFGLKSNFNYILTTKKNSDPIKR